MHLFIVGAGHVGLVTAVGLCRLGHTVTLADTDRERLARIDAGDPWFFEPGLVERLREELASGRLRTTIDPLPPADAEASIVCVPTPSGADGILSMHIVEAVVRRLLDATGPGHTIVVRSTMPLDGPDRLDALVADRGTRAKLIVNPEFMREGSALRDFDEPHRVLVGALTESDRPAAEAFAHVYDALAKPVVVTDARSAVLIKIASNVFLATKISFANELARLAEAIGADIGAVVDGIGLDARIGRAFLTPGPGYGGSCLPEQAIALDVEAARRGVPAPLLAGVASANAVHQEALVAQLAERLGGSLRERRIAVLGLAFKANTDDARLSPALAVIAALRAAGADVVGHDPMAEAHATSQDPQLAVAATVEEAVAGADAVLVTTEWPSYAALDWAALAPRMRGDLVQDTRSIVDGDRVRAAGLRFASLGRVADPGPAADADDSIDDRPTAGAASGASR